jgi:hypothetical protein
MPTVRAVLKRAALDDYGWGAIIAGIVMIAPFQKKNIVP